MLNKMSFGEWCENNNHQDFIDLWDYELNQKSPFEVSTGDKKKYYFKCANNSSHKSELHYINRFHVGKQTEIVCKQCNSFGQYIIDSTSEEYFKKIWSDKNTVDPMKIGAKTNQVNVYLKCANNINHPDYLRQPNVYSRGSTECPICSNLQNRTSLGKDYPKSLEVWSDKNNYTPFDYTSLSNQYAYWKCPDGKHSDFKRLIYSATESDFTCPKCLKETLDNERKLQLIGKTYGHLTVIKVDERDYLDQRIHWICQCDCGEIVSVPTYLLKLGSITSCGNKSIHYKGENGPNWQGGITNERLLARSRVEYKKWCKDVYSKDWFICQCCGSNKILNAHHILNFANNIDLRYEVSNGITLCKRCHHSTVQGSFHNIYGTTNNTPEQLEEFINNKRKELGINIPFVLEDYLNGDILKPNIV